MSYIVIDKQRCKGCEFCVAACPKQIITISSELNSSSYYPAMVSDNDKCTGCALCAIVCPEVAIEVYKEEGRRQKS